MRQPLECPTCNCTDIGSVHFDVIRDGGADLHYCRRCEGRWWTSDGVRIELDDVLRSASVLGKAS